VSEWTQRRLETHAARAERRRLAVGRGVLAAVTVLVITGLYGLYWTAWSEGRAQRSFPRTSDALHIEGTDVGLYQTILPGDTRGDLARGPGLAPGSGTLRFSGPIVVVGHRTAYGAPFQHLGALGPGTVLNLRQGTAAADFVVDRRLDMAPAAAIPIPKGPQALVLVTAAGGYLAPDRLVIIAHRVGGQTSEPAALVRLPSLRGSSVNLALGTMILLLIAGAWGIRGVLRERWRPWERWVSLAAIGVLVPMTVHLLIGSLSPLI
jgi:sortase (surface protein transpeptidase)